MHRFFLPPGAWAEPALSADESHHALSVLRLGAGDRVAVFDGRGTEGTAEILPDPNRRGARLRVIHSAKTPPLPCRITLAQAVPKGKNMDLIVQKATELGAAEIAPLLSERTAVSYDASDAAAKQSRWHATVLEAAKQCGQNWLPEVGRPMAPKDFFAGRGRSFDLMLVASLQPDAWHLRDWLADWEPPAAPPRSALVLVGPEGDFTPAELGLAKAAGCRPITLGPIVLRVETAAIYCMSILAYELLGRVKKG